MRHRKFQAQYDQLVMAVASGKTIKAWCAANGFCYGTACHWSRTQAFQDAVRAIHKERLDAFIGRLTAASEELAEGLIRLARNAKSEPVKLGAIRGAVDDLVKIANYAALKDEIAELKLQIRRLGAGSETTHAAD